jgi:hypothetical protein
MKLTPEQEAQIERECSADPSRSSFLIKPTSEQDRILAGEISREDAAQAANVARCRRLESLLKQDSLSGALRRALDEAEMSRDEIAGAAGIEPTHLADFFWGDLDLQANEIDRLAKALQLRLVHA